MASIAKRDGMWRAQLATLGVRESKTFNTKAEAAAWAAKRETEIREGAATGIQKGRTLDDAFRRYEKEVSVHKRGHRQEILRMGAIGRTVIEGTALKDMKLVDITSNVPRPRFRPGADRPDDNRLPADRCGIPVRDRNGYACRRDMRADSGIYCRPHGNAPANEERHQALRATIPARLGAARPSARRPSWRIGLCYDGAITRCNVPEGQAARHDQRWHLPRHTPLGNHAAGEEA